LRFAIHAEITAQVAENSGTRCGAFPQPATTPATRRTNSARVSRRGVSQSDRFLRGGRWERDAPIINAPENTAIVHTSSCTMNTDTMTTTVTSESTVGRPRAWTRFVPAVPRVLLGLPMAVFGTNAFLNFIPPPATPLPESAMAFSVALVATGYMMPLIGVTQLLAGVLLVVNRFVPLALVLLAPFLVNAVAFHVFLEPSGRGPVAVFAALELIMLWWHRRAFRPLLQARAG
jgi:hypothetical protein